MLNATTEVTPPLVVDYGDASVAKAMASGEMNTTEPQLLAHIRHAIRQGHPQWRTGPLRHDRICLVGSGPSLHDTVDELRELVWQGATLVTMNGGYQWCIEHGFRPQTQIVLDARASNARFLSPAVPKCNYVLASQCAPAAWDAVAGRDHVWIFHAVIKESGVCAEALDQYYNNQWIGIGGGTTVATRAIMLLRVAGYVRFDLFGVDCCWMGAAHHALAQPENAHDAQNRIRAGITGHPDTFREFVVAPWHLKQAEDLFTIMQVNGKHFSLASHGDGMFSHLLTALGSADADSIVFTQGASDGSTGVQTL